MPHVVEAFFSYFLLFNVGLYMVYNFAMHVFFGEMAASFIGCGCKRTPVRPPDTITRAVETPRRERSDGFPRRPRSGAGANTLATAGTVRSIACVCGTAGSVGTVGTMG